MLMAFVLGGGVELCIVDDVKAITLKQTGPLFDCFTCGTGLFYTNSHNSFWLATSYTFTYKSKTIGALSLSITSTPSYLNKASISKLTQLRGHDGVSHVLL